MSRRALSRPWLWAATGGLAASLALGPSAQAHAFLISSSPPAGAVLLEAPRQVILRYSENVAERLSSFPVYNNQRDAVSGRAQVQGRQVVLPIQPLPPGTYTLRWHVVSADDGHATEGSFVFSVWHGGPLPPAAGEAARTSADVQGGPLGAVVRWLAFLGTFALVGAAFLDLAIGRGMRRRWASFGHVWIAAPAGSHGLYLARGSRPFWLPLGRATGAGLQRPKAFGREPTQASTGSACAMPRPSAPTPRPPSTSSLAPCAASFALPMGAATGRW